jgi:hypothetical protein
MQRFTAALPVRGLTCMLAAAVTLGVAGCTKVSNVAAPAGPTPQVQALLDRAAIEDLYADYYANFGGDDHDFARYYTADGELDVNGMVAKGTDAITTMYVQSSGGPNVQPPRHDPQAPPRGKLELPISNLKVDVHGNAATVDLVWSSLEADSVVGAPRVNEFGREHTTLVRQDGKWLMQHREITSYGGMPKSLLKSYVVR